MKIQKQTLKNVYICIAVHRGYVFFGLEAFSATTANVYILWGTNATCMLHSFQKIIKVKLCQNWDDFFFDKSQTSITGANSL